MNERGEFVCGRIQREVAADRSSLITTYRFKLHAEAMTLVGSDHLNLHYIRACAVKVKKEYFKLLSRWTKILESKLIFLLFQVSFVKKEV